MIRRFEGQKERVGIPGCGIMLTLLLSGRMDYMRS